MATAEFNLTSWSSNSVKLSDKARGEDILDVDSVVAKPYGHSRVQLDIMPVKLCETKQQSIR